MATDGWLVLTTRLLGALSLFAVGFIHLQQYNELYSAIPTIGTLFLLSFVGATVVSLSLSLPVERLPGIVGRWAPVLLALAGIGQAVMQFVFLAISEQRPLFGFQEPGYHPDAILAARVTEILTVIFLTTFLISRWMHRRASARTASGGSTLVEEREHHNVGTR